jgi:hypothetical protein
MRRFTFITEVSDTMVLDIAKQLVLLWMDERSDTPEKDISIEISRNQNISVF